MAASLRTAITATKMVDLTQIMHESMPIWPGGIPFKMTRLADYDKGYRLHKFEMGENTGTHIDAPSHFVPNKRDIDTIPLRDLIVPGVVIDVKDKVAKDSDYQLTPQDIFDWESKYGNIPSGSLVLLNTGWASRFISQSSYDNLDHHSVMHFPGFGKDSATLLVSRDVVGIGIDTLSLDAGCTKHFDTHHIILGANKYQIENLCNLDALPAVGATIMVGVLPVKGGTQAQARIIALLP